jgi:hypothetical protein
MAGPRADEHGLVEESDLFELVITSDLVFLSVAFGRTFRIRLSVSLSSSAFCARFVLANYYY